MNRVTPDASGDETGDDPPQVRPDGRPAQAPAGEGPFDWHGWVLVGVIVLSFLVIPVAVLVLPRAQGVLRTFGLPWQDAYWALPMLPAILLGGTAVWAAVRTRRG
ncbi:hypothetical protein ACKVMT_00065 [Halobacteriales archaeon Cl-PHB]